MLCIDVCVKRKEFEAVMVTEKNFGEVKAWTGGWMFRRKGMFSWDRGKVVYSIEDPRFTKETFDSLPAVLVRSKLGKIRAYTPGGFKRVFKCVAHVPTKVEGFDDTHA